MRPEVSAMSAFDTALCVASLPSLFVGAVTIPEIKPATAIFREVNTIRRACFALTSEFLSSVSARSFSITAAKLERRLALAERRLTKIEPVESTRERLPEEIQPRTFQSFTQNLLQNPMIVNLVGCQKYCLLLAREVAPAKNDNIYIDLGLWVGQCLGKAALGDRISEDVSFVIKSFVSDLPRPFNTDPPDFISMPSSSWSSIDDLWSLTTSLRDMLWAIEVRFSEQESARNRQRLVQLKQINDSQILNAKPARISGSAPQSSKTPCYDVACPKGVYPIQHDAYLIAVQSLEGRKFAIRDLQEALKRRKRQVHRDTLHTWLTKMKDIGCVRYNGVPGRGACYQWILSYYKPV